MPIYAYRCAECGHSKDVLQRLSDAPLSACPACGAEAFRKQVTAAGFQLRGSGWYATDFKNNGAVAKPTAAAGEGGADAAAAAPAVPAKADAGSGAAEKSAEKGAGKVAEKAAAAPAVAPPPAAPAPSGDASRS